MVRAQVCGAGGEAAEVWKVSSAVAVREGGTVIKMCHGLRHYFDIVDGKLALVCRCGKMKRKLAQ